MNAFAALALLPLLASGATGRANLETGVYSEARVRSPYIGVRSDDAAVADAALLPTLSLRLGLGRLAGQVSWAPRLLYAPEGQGARGWSQRGEVALGYVRSPARRLVLSQRLGYGVTDFALSDDSPLTPRPSISAARYLESLTRAEASWDPVRRVRLSASGGYVVGGSPGGERPEVPLQRGPFLNLGVALDATRTTQLHLRARAADASFSAGSRIGWAVLDAQIEHALGARTTLRAAGGAAALRDAHRGGEWRWMPAARTELAHAWGPWEAGVYGQLAPFVSPYNVRLFPRLEALGQVRVTRGRLRAVTRLGAASEWGARLGEATRLLDAGVDWRLRDDVTLSLGGSLEWQRPVRGGTAGVQWASSLGVSWWFDHALRSASVPLERALPGSEVVGRP